MSETLINCYGCIDCIDCKDCDYCEYCDRVINGDHDEGIADTHYIMCKNCQGLYYCSDYENCADCKNCKPCVFCGYGDNMCSI